MQLTGMHRVAEKNLENLNAAQLKNLMRKGILARIYMHLLSLENFGRLLDRRSGRKAELSPRSPRRRVRRARGAPSQRGHRTTGSAGSSRGRRSPP